MWHRLSLVTEPEDPALTPEAVKAHLRVDHADEDALIEGLIAAAVAMVDGPDGIGFAMQPQTWRLTLDRFPRIIHLGLRPVVSVDAITYTAPDETEQTVPTADYHVTIAGGQARIVEAIGAAWPSLADLPGVVKVDFVAGEGVPAPLRAAMLLMIGDWYENRQGASVGKEILPNPAVEAILNRYRSLAVTA